MDIKPILENYSPKDVGLALLDLTLKPEYSDENKIQFLNEYLKLTKEKYNQSFKEKAKLVEIINNEDEIAKKNNDDKVPEISRLAVKAFNAQKLSDLISLSYDHPDTAAAKLITNKYSQRYGALRIKELLNRKEDVIALTSVQAFISTIENNKSYRPQEANFLDNFSSRLIHLAHAKYKKASSIEGVKEASLNPKFTKEAGRIWNCMMESFDQYATYDLNTKPNFEIRALFPKQVKQLSERIKKQSLAPAFKYFQNIDKLLTYIAEYEKSHNISFNGDLQYDMASAGVNSRKDALKCLGFWHTLNKRPDKYSSTANEYNMRDIARVVKADVQQDWMIPVMLEAMNRGVLELDTSNLPSVDCCKTWKICPTMPQKLASKVGSYKNLIDRMLAGAIFEKLNSDVKITPKEWETNKKLQVLFFDELSVAVSMDKDKALKQYIPDTPINRKRLVGVRMDDQKMKCTTNNFKKVYRELEKRNFFKLTLARSGEEEFSINPSLLYRCVRNYQQK